MPEGPDSPTDRLGHAPPFSGYTDSDQPLAGYSVLATAFTTPLAAGITSAHPHGRGLRRSIHERATDPAERAEP